jgi:O-antigen/teichoic acid export membrane protein
MLDYFKDSFRKNSLFYAGAIALSDLVGFIFWIVAARYYNVADVGLATALLASVNLIYILSRLGLDAGIVRFMHSEKDKATLINTSLTVVSISTVVLSIVFLCGLNIWSAALKPVLGDFALVAMFILLALLFSVFWILNAIFLAFRQAQLSLIQVAVLSLRILLVVLLINLGLMGILSSYAIAIAAAIVCAFILLSRLLPGFRPVPTIRKSVIQGISSFTFGNYFADTFRMLPGLILPILIVNLISVESGAFFYMAWMAGATIFGAINAICSVLLAEMVTDREQIGKNIIKALRMLGLVAGSAVLVTLVLGRWILWLFGVNYADAGANLLSILAISAIPLAVNEVFIAIKRLEKNITPIVWIRAFTAAATIVGGMLLSQYMGIVGVGIVMLASQFLVAVIVFPQLVRTVRKGPLNDMAK